MRPAAFLSSTTGHAGMVVDGSKDVFVNGKKAAGVGHAVICPQHGPTAIATGRTDVLLNGKPMSRLMDKVICVGTAKPGSGGPLIDHGKPSGTVRGYDIHADGSLADVPEAELDALLAAIQSGDPVAIQRAWNALPLKATLGKGTIKFVDPSNPNSWHELEITGPGGGIAGPAGSELDPSKGGGRLQGGGSLGAFGVKGSKVTRYVGSDGAIHERREAFSLGASEGGSFDIEWSERRKGVYIDTPWVFGQGAEDIKIGPAGTQPAIDVILPPVAADVFLGD